MVVTLLLIQDVGLKRELFTLSIPQPLLLPLLPLLELALFDVLHEVGLPVAIPERLPDEEPELTDELNIVRRRLRFF